MPPSRPHVVRLASRVGAAVLALALGACAGAPRDTASAQTARLRITNLGAQVWRLEFTRLGGVASGPANPDNFSWEIAPSARQSVQVRAGDYRVRRVALNASGEAPAATRSAKGELVALRAGETYAWTLGAPSDVDAKTPAP